MAISDRHCKAPKTSGSWVPRPKPAGDPLAEFFESEEGTDVWQQWYCGQIGQGRIKERYGGEVMEAIFASEVIVRVRTREKLVTRESVMRVWSLRGRQLSVAMRKEKCCGKVALFQFGTRSVLGAFVRLLGALKNPTSNTRNPQKVEGLAEPPDLAP